MIDCNLGKQKMLNLYNFQSKFYFLSLNINSGNYFYCLFDYDKNAVFSFAVI